MPLHKHDLVVVLGSQIKFDPSEKRYSLAPHTALKAEAAAIAINTGVTNRMIVSGGFNFYVRYQDEAILPQPDFSFNAFVSARRNRISEAQAIRDVMEDVYAADPWKVMLEELSATTEENALFVAEMLKRTTFSDVKSLGVLTLAYHMEKALPTFKAALPGTVTVEPLFAENLMATQGPRSIQAVIEYYERRKTGKQYDLGLMSDLLKAGTSLAEMMA